MTTRSKQHNDNLKCLYEIYLKGVYHPQDIVKFHSLRQYREMIAKYTLQHPENFDVIDLYPEIIAEIFQHYPIQLTKKNIEVLFNNQYRDSQVLQEAVDKINILITLNALASALQQTQDVPYKYWESYMRERPSDAFLRYIEDHYQEFLLHQLELEEKRLLDTDITNYLEELRNDGLLNDLIIQTTPLLNDSKATQEKIDRIREASGDKKRLALAEKQIHERMPDALTPLEACHRVLDMPDSYSLWNAFQCLLWKAREIPCIQELT